MLFERLGAGVAFFMTAVAILILKGRTSEIAHLQLFKLHTPWDIQGTCDVSTLIG
jgi:hypothetical protein